MKPRVVGWRAILAAIALAVAYCPRAAAEFPINTYTTGNQSYPAIAMSGSGEFVVVWQHALGLGADVLGQRFDATGSPVGSEFAVNTFTTDRQILPAVAVDGTGKFVVVWEGQDDRDGDQFGIFARRYDGAGVPLGEFQVNVYTTGRQVFPRVAAGPGGFVVVWAGTDQDGSSYGIFGRRYDGAGAALGGEFQVNTYTTGFQFWPDVAVDGAGNFVVVWAMGSETTELRIVGQRYDSGGVALGGEFQVSTDTALANEVPHVAMQGAGGFLIVWRITRSVSDRDVMARRYDGAGVPAGAEFRVNTYTRGRQQGATVAVDGAGGFVVAWGSDDDQDGSAGRVIGQRYDAAGLPLGGEFQLNTHTFSDQRAPTVGADSAGNFVVAWESWYQDGPSLGVFGQRNKPDRIVRGHSMFVRNPGDEDDRMLVAMGKEKPTDIGTSIDGDPTAAGATLRVIASGGTDTDQTYVLDASGWRRLGSTGFGYAGPTGGDGDPVRRVVIKRRPGGSTLFRAILDGGLGSQSLDVVPPDPGDDVRLVLQFSNGGGTYCVTLGAAFGSTESLDTAQAWQLSGATAEAACPP